MTVFSKLFSERPGFINIVNMSLLHELYQNNFIIPAVGTLIVCVISYYLIKWVSNDVVVPVPSSSKHHNWKPIKITAKVGFDMFFISFLNDLFCRHGIVQFARRFY